VDEGDSNICSHRVASRPAIQVLAQLDRVSRSQEPSRSPIIDGLDPLSDLLFCSFSPQQAQCAYSTA
jgi:hypothetical protein